MYPWPFLDCFVLLYSLKIYCKIKIGMPTALSHVNKPAILITLLMISILTSTGCSKKEDKADPPITEKKTLKKTALFPVGAAVSVTHLKEEAFSTTFKENYNQLTAEYEMKMNAVWTSLNIYNWTNADYLVNYAVLNNMKIHGHALLWYQSFPEWFKTAAYDSLNFENSVKTYIQTFVGRYKGKISSWDVANEIFADDGALRVETIVYKTFKDPVAFYGRCFQYTRLSDPDVKLFYNDYNLVLNYSKRSSVVRMVERFRKEGYPIDGIGEQFHTTVGTSMTIISNGLTDLVGTGLLIHFSELDIKVNKDKSDSYVFTDAYQQKQADMYSAIVEIFETLPQRQKYAITTWGVTDKYTWLIGFWHPKEYPLLFDNNYYRKKAYDGFISGLN
jgi:endo-1,4-beta-xylanase